MESNNKRELAKETLIDWCSNMMDYMDGCTITLREWNNKLNTYVIKDDIAKYLLDGYSQYQYLANGSYSCRFFDLDKYLIVYTVGIKDGLALLYNKESSNTDLYGVGEDDGIWFLTDLCDEILHKWKPEMMSAIANISTVDIPHQEIIEKIWKL